MFKRNLISLAILVGLTGGLAGCNSDNDSSSSLPGDPIVDLAVLKYVDPMIGTAASGHTFPGATVPAGMVQLSPDTFIGSNTDHESGLNPWHSASGYWDSSNYETGEVVNTDVPLYGFSHTHLSGTGATDLGDILVLPYADMANTQLNSFDKANEEASAGYYKTKLNQGQIEVELSATKRVG
ncbi:glycoside hydrolase family 92 protein, partial [Vibrio alginolyticus]|nr:glycoside hydrolase family 92 protein [Vibrio alginolyticus]MDW2199690.1 glycoside hydrolase family 92 protein [Vibrio sp. 2084]